MISVVDKIIFLINEIIVKINLRLILLFYNFYLLLLLLLLLFYFIIIIVINNFIINIVNILFL